jgi:hypothetical protein
LVFRGQKPDSKGKSPTPVCIGRCDPPKKPSVWQRNRAIYLVANPLPNGIKLPPANDFAAFTAFTIRNDVIRPHVDNLPLTAIVIDGDENPAILPGWKAYDAD